METAVKRCRRIAFADWKHLFDMAGKEVTLTLFDVTGQGEVTISDWGIEGDNPEIPIGNLGPRVVTMPRKR